MIRMIVTEESCSICGQNASNVVLEIPGGIAIKLCRPCRQDITATFESLEKHRNTDGYVSVVSFTRRTE